MITGSIDNEFSEAVRRIVKRIQKRIEKDVTYDDRIHVDEYSESGFKNLLKEHKDLNKLFNKELSDLLYERIGIRYRFILDANNSVVSDVGAAVYTSAGISSIIFPTHTEVKNWTIEKIDDWYGDIDHFIHIDNEKLFHDFDDYRAKLNYILNRYMKMNDLLEENKITFDCKNNRVNNLPSDITFPVILGLGDFMFKDAEDDETSGVVLHECGHVYTALYFANFSTLNNISFIRDLSTKLTEESYSKEVFDKTVQILEVNDMKTYSKNSEYVADMFAADFGFGVGISKFLIGNRRRRNSIYKTYHPVNYSYTIQPPTVVKKEKKEHDERDDWLHLPSNPYDTDFRRSKRILNDLLRKLRNGEGNENQLAGIDYIDKMLKTVVVKTEPDPNKEISDMIEDLLNNRLIASVARLDKKIETQKD